MSPSNQSQSSLESRARRAAKRVGLIMHKSRKAFSIDNYGEFMLVDSNNCVEAGERFDLTAEDVLAHIAEVY